MTASIYSEYAYVEIVMGCSNNLPITINAVDVTYVLVHTTTLVLQAGEIVCGEAGRQTLQQ